MPKIKDLGIKVVPETMRPPEIGGGGGCTDCTVQAFSICGGTPGGGGCTDCTLRPFSICGGSPGCTDCTLVPFSICGGTPRACGHPLTHCICTANSPCLCTHLGSIPCIGTCGYSNIPYQPAGELTRDQIVKLKEQLQQQITALDEHAKTLGPKSLEEISAREKQLNEELAELQARKKTIKK